MRYVVVIDDEKMVEEYLETILKRAGYSEASFTEPNEALDFIKQNRGDIAPVVADLTMPRMTGAKLAEELMNVKADIPVILVTGALAAPGADELSGNVKTVLQKPMTRRQFIQTVEMLIG
ncbi:MAG: C4-dicarboxylate transport transcriptional regulatory protein DctD [Syntrophorhabdaceae bacterium PtaU1.Bin034]|nr:MAG: C4-dicarboxylate transport transcriptional regulatory protein DctD [Syntrophorhabdaceae bacterium PtaU1.Bin034]